MSKRSKRRCTDCYFSVFEFEAVSQGCDSVALFLQWTLFGLFCLRTPSLGSLGKIAASIFGTHGGLGSCAYGQELCSDVPDNAGNFEIGKAYDITSHRDLLAQMPTI